MKPGEKQSLHQYIKNIKDRIQVITDSQHHFSKLMESIIRDAIVEHMTKNDLFADEQHGFVPGRDCVSQLLMCLEEWTKFIERGECFDVIYTDFCKAFDSVPHERLLIKLKSIGIGGDILFWITSFLKG